MEEYKFMPCECKFDEKRDICEVDQSGFVDLVSAYENHSIDGNLSVDEDTFNGIDEPDSILGIPKDVFDSAHMRQTLSDYKAPSNNSDGVE